MNDTFIVDVNLMTQLGKEIRRCRRYRRMSQSDLARTAGMTQRIISEIERGKANCTLETVERLANVLGRRPDLKLRPGVK